MTVVSKLLTLYKAWQIDRLRAKVATRTIALMLERMNEQLGRDMIDEEEADIAFRYAEWLAADLARGGRATGQP